MKKELYITDLIRRIKTTEGLLREKLEIDDQRWEESMQKYSIFEQNAKELIVKSRAEQTEDKSLDNLNLDSQIYTQENRSIHTNQS